MYQLKLPLGIEYPIKFASGLSPFAMSIFNFYILLKIDILEGKLLFVLII